jgi:hypothetical protein
MDGRRLCFIGLNSEVNGNDEPSVLDHDGRSFDDASGNHRCFHQSSHPVLTSSRRLLIYCRSARLEAILWIAACIHRIPNDVVGVDFDIAASAP